MKLINVAVLFTFICMTGCVFGGATNTVVSVGTSTNASQGDSEAVLRGRIKSILEDPNLHLSDSAALLNEIQTRRLVALRKDLQMLASVMRERGQGVPKTVIKRRNDPRMMAMRDIEVTAIWLEMCEMGISTEKECVAFMVNRIEELAAKRAVFDAPYSFLQANVDRVWPCLLERFDETVDKETKHIILSILGACSDVGLEDQLLARVAAYTDAEPIYARLLTALGSVGGEKSVTYLKNVADVGTDRQREVASSVLATRSANKRRPFKYSGQWSTNAWPRQ